MLYAAGHVSAWRTILGLLARLAGTFLCAAAFALAVLLVPCFFVDRLTQCNLRSAPGDEAAGKVLELGFALGLMLFGGVFFFGVLKRLIRGAPQSPGR